MKKTFVIQVEYPDCDFVSSEEVMEVTQECIEHYMELHFGANIMDGDYDRIKVKEVTDGFSLVKRMREAQKKEWEIKSKQACGKELDEHTDIVTHLEREVDEYLKKMESIDKRKALEAENTEFDYGHDVKHYSED